MMKFILINSWILFLYSCGGANAPQENIEKESYDPKIGIGRFSKVDIEDVIEEDKALQGESIYQKQCFSCHKLSDEMLVGPGWKNVTKRRDLVWLMNFMTNTNEMLENDPELKKQIELCNLRMPQLNLTDDEARAILEFMRKNDL